MGRVKTCFTWQFLFTLVKGHIIWGDTSLESQRVLGYDLSSSNQASSYLQRIESQEKKENRISSPTVHPQSLSVASGENGASNTIPTTLSIISNDIQVIWNATGMPFDRLWASEKTRIVKTNYFWGPVFLFIRGTL
jgi:hypothetical protein